MAAEKNAYWMSCALKNSDHDRLYRQTQFESMCQEVHMTYLWAEVKRSDLLISSKLRFARCACGGSSTAPDVLAESSCT